MALQGKIRSKDHGWIRKLMKFNKWWSLHVDRGTSMKENACLPFMNILDDCLRIWEMLTKAKYFFKNACKGLQKFNMHVMTTILGEKCKIWGIKCTQSLHDMPAAHSEIH